jgi:hypothetical protein
MKRWVHDPVLSLICCFNANFMFTVMCNGVLIGPQAAVPWFSVYPAGMRSFLGWIRERYGNPPVYVTENGDVQMLC